MNDRLIEQIKAMLDRIHHLETIVAELQQQVKELSK